MNKENKKNLLKVFELRKPSNYESDDNIKFYVKRTMVELSKIFNLNEKIKIEDFKDLNELSKNALKEELKKWEESESL